VLELMDTDLERIIASNNDLTDHHVQYFIYQVLRGLKYIHSANVIHRDLKPSNLLLNADCDLKICDFGLARGVKDDVDLTKYVVTRWYRAPELLCSCTDYDEKIDVWSVGCILAELLGRSPLFPGEDYIKQMDLIFGVLGTPNGREDMNFISNEKAYAYIKRLKKRPKIPFSEIYPSANPQALDLLEKMLMFNPRKRSTVDEALQHPYLEDLHLPESETVCRQKFDFSFEDRLTDRASLQAYMFDEVAAFRPECASLRTQMLREGSVGKGFDFDTVDDGLSKMVL
jgi:serine/threonine protein kinase